MATVPGLARIGNWLGLGGWLLAGAVAAAAGAEPKPDAARDPGWELFHRAWVPGDSRSHGGDGLGPVFNERSCLACHHQGGGGGGGSGDKNIEIATASGGGIPGGGFFYAFSMNFGGQGFEYRIGTPERSRPPALNLVDLVKIHPGFRIASSVVLHRYGPDGDYRTWRDAVAGPHGAILVKTSQRNPTPLFGMGLIDAIPNEAIEAAAKRKSGAVKGRISRLPDGRIGRFGWKAQTATLREFVLSAAANELGLEQPDHHQGADPRVPPLAAPGLDLTADECAALVRFVRDLPSPVALDPAGPREEKAVKAGAALFKTIGCAQCHLPRLGDVEGIYSDLLLHDMSPRLSDTGFYGVFTAHGGAPPGAVPPRAAPGRKPTTAALAEWRTPPLWGLRDSAPYLHDGQAGTVEEAVALHGGQGSASAQRYAQLAPRERQQVDAFLLSLAAPRKR